MSLQKLEEKIGQLLEAFSGKAGVAVETEEGWIGFHENEPFLAASLIKVPIMIETYRQVQEGRLSLSQLYQIPEKKRVGGSGVLSSLREQVYVSLQDLISLMIMVSDNTATNLLIEQVGFDAVNQLASKLKCDQTLLGRKLMDYAAKRRGLENFTSAGDMVRFFKEIMEGSLLNETYKNCALDVLKKQQFQAKLPGKILDHLEGHDFIAHKTGEMRDYEHDAGILSVNGKIAYVAVLTSHGTDAFSRRNLIADVGKALFDYLRE
ncbi:serine hydrolase [Thermoflavimicrobium dichotomicum]|uniref:Beta-lactamase class A n=1 Tax=Thermoflavimicrobium dichotomicum TaxID=46223 RepID=A0A1I3UDI7_9BACL|nr:serine hydrolase [Thermoflavimicrobium dichotomicum]SFJ79936.1 beta-lactamase class A [Thermoflavimicrobium dichotomicum]